MRGKWVAILAAAVGLLLLAVVFLQREKENPLPAAPGRSHRGGAAIPALHSGQQVSEGSRPAGGTTPIRGHVREARGSAPIADADVSAFGAFLGANIAAGETRSDDTGAFELAVAPGTWRFVASADGFAPEERLLPANAEVELDFELLPASHLSGKVVKLESHTKVPKATVTASRERGFGRGTPVVATADEEGRFSFDQLPAGEYLLTARSGNLVGQSRQPAAVAIGEHVGDLLLEVSAGHSASGQVETTDGKPIAGAAVRLRGSGGFGGGASGGGRTSGPETTTRADGSFRLEGVLPGRYSLEAEAEGFAKGSIEAIDLSASDTAGLAVRLAAGAIITGQVALADGSSQAGIEVRVRVAGGRGGGGRGGGFRGGGGWNPAGTTRTAPDGSYRVDGLAEGPVSVEASLASTGLATAGPIELSAGETKTLDLVLASGATVAGTIRMADGSLATSATVTAINRATMSVQQTTIGKDGTFQINPLGPGDWTVRAAKDMRGAFGFRTNGEATADVHLEGTERHGGIELTLPRSGLSIKGMVRGPDGVVPNAEVSARPDQPGSRPGASYSGPDGTFTLDDLDEGTYQLRAVRNGYGPAEAADVVAGAVGVELVLQQPTLLAGTVVGEDKNPVANYTLAVNVSGSTRWRQPLVTSTINDPSGAFQITGLGAGTFDLVVSSADGRTGKLSGVTLAAGQTEGGLVITITRGATLTGVIVSQAGNAPVAGATVNAGGNGVSVSTTTAPDGSFTLSGILPATRVTVFVLPMGNRLLPDRYQILSPADNAAANMGTLRLVAGTPDPTAVGTGISAQWIDGTTIVGHVSAGSPASEAGLRQGATLLAIGGTSTAGLGGAAMSFLLAGPAGTAVDVTLAGSGAAQETVSLTRQPNAHGH